MPAHQRTSFERNRSNSDDTGRAYFHQHVRNGWLWVAAKNDWYEFVGLDGLSLVLTSMASLIAIKSDKAEHYGFAVQKIFTGD